MATADTKNEKSPYGFLQIPNQFIGTSSFHNDGAVYAISFNKNFNSIIFKITEDPQDTDSAYTISFPFDNDNADSLDDCAEKILMHTGYEGYGNKELIAIIKSHFKNIALSSDEKTIDASGFEIQKHDNVIIKNTKEHGKILGVLGNKAIVQKNESVSLFDGKDIIKNNDFKNLKKIKKLQCEGTTAIIVETQKNVDCANFLSLLMENMNIEGNIFTRIDMVSECGPISPMAPLYICVENIGKNQTFINLAKIGLSKLYMEMTICNNNTIAIREHANVKLDEIKSLKRIENHILNGLISEANYIQNRPTIATYKGKSFIIIENTYGHEKYIKISKSLADVILNPRKVELLKEAQSIQVQRLLKRKPTFGDTLYTEAPQAFNMSFDEYKHSQIIAESLLNNQTIYSYECNHKFINKIINEVNLGKLAEKEAGEILKTIGTQAPNEDFTPIELYNIFSEYELQSKQITKYIIHLHKTNEQVPNALYMLFNFMPSKEPAILNIIKDYVNEDIDNNMENEIKSKIFKILLGDYNIEYMRADDNGK